MRGLNSVFLILHAHPVIAFPYSVPPCALFSVTSIVLLCYFPEAAWLRGQSAEPGVPSSILATGFVLDSPEFKSPPTPER